MTVVHRNENSIQKLAKRTLRKLMTNIKLTMRRCNDTSNFTFRNQAMKPNLDRCLILLIENWTINNITQYNQTVAVV